MHSTGSSNTWVSTDKEYKPSHSCKKYVILLVFHFQRPDQPFPPSTRKSVMSSVATLYAMHGASAGKAAWAKHPRPQDPASSEFSAAMHLGQPGVGDKMFNNAPPRVLTSISASPSETVKSSFDSIMDVDAPSPKWWTLCSIKQA